MSACANWAAPSLWLLTAAPPSKLRCPVSSRVPVLRDSQELTLQIVAWCMLWNYRFVNGSRGCVISAKILIVDDHDVVRQGVKSFLAVRSDWEICGEAA